MASSDSGENIGYDQSKFIGLTTTQKEELVCSICFGIFNKPMVTSCGCTFCNDCIRDWLTNGNNSCPLDRELLTVYDLRVAPRSLNNIINKLVMRCENEMLGCKGFPLEDSPTHATNCKFHPQPHFDCNDFRKMATIRQFFHHDGNDVNSIMKSLSITNSASEGFAPSAPPVPAPSAPPLSKIPSPSLPMSLIPNSSTIPDVAEIAVPAAVRFKPIVNENFSLANFNFAFFYQLG